MTKEGSSYRDEVKVHLQYIREKVDNCENHLEKINGRLQKAEKDINTHKAVGITISTIVGFVLTYLGIKG